MGTGPACPPVVGTTTAPKEMPYLHTFPRTMNVLHSKTDSAGTIKVPDRVPQGGCPGIFLAPHESLMAEVGEDRSTRPAIAGVKPQGPHGS